MAGDGGVTITFGADDTEVMRALRRMQTENEKLKTKLGEVGEASRKAGKESGDAWNSTGKAIAAGLASTVSLGTATAVITRELQDQVRIYKEISKLQSQIAGPQANFIRNAGTNDPKELAKLTRQIEQASKQTGVSQGVLYDAAANAFAAKGLASNEDAIRAVTLGARMAPDNPGEAQTIAGGLLDLGSLTGTFDEKTNAGFMLSMGSQTRVTNLQQIAQNLVPAAINVQGRGGTAGDAAALVTTLSSAMKDTTGATSGNAAASLAGQLAEFLPESDSFTYVNGRPKLDRKGTGLTEIDDRIRRLQENKKERDEFLAGLTIEQKAAVPVRDLLTPGTDTAKLFEQNRGGYSGVMSEQTEAFLKTLGTPQLQQHADLERRAATVAENANLNNPAAAARGAVYEQYPKFQEATGQGDIERLVKYWDMLIAEGMQTATGGRMGANPAQIAIRQIEKDQAWAAKNGNSDPEMLKIQSEYLELMRRFEARMQAPPVRNPDAERHIERGG